MSPAPEPSDDWSRLPARILIVDDHLAARITIRELLDWHSFQVCGDAKDGKEAIEKVIELKPDIVLQDITQGRVPCTIAGASWIVRNTIFVGGEIRRISWAAAVPFIPGMLVHGFVPKSAAGTELIPILHRLAGDLPDGRDVAETRVLCGRNAWVD